MNAAYDRVAADYARRRFFGRVGFGERAAILVVDLQNGFTDPDSPLGADLSAEITATRALLDAARSRRIPVLYTVIGFGADPDEAGVWSRKMPHIHDLRVGEESTRIDGRLGALAGEPVIVKRFASAFHGTDLDTRLRASAIDTVIVTGTSTSGCIRASVVDLMQNGYRAIVPRECVGDRAPEPHAAALFDIDAKYGDVVSLDGALAYLNGFLTDLESK